MRNSSKEKLDGEDDEDDHMSQQRSLVKFRGGGDSDSQDRMSNTFKGSTILKNGGYRNQ